MIHSLAHPLSAQHQTHHGLANALLLPDSMEFIENSVLNDEQQSRVTTVIGLFAAAGLAKDSLAETCRSWFTTLGITFGLKNHHIPADNMEFLAQQAFEDPCHHCNIIPVTKEDLLGVYRKAY